MVTFNVDSLDFSDGEAIRTGADDDFSTQYSSSNDRLEIEDLTNATVGHIPRDTGTDLVGGKFAETVAEGKALSDNGQVYDSIQAAVDNASSWVKVGPGDFRESVTIDTAGLTLEGSGERTVIDATTDSIRIDAPDVYVRDFKLMPFNNGVTERANGTNGTVSNIFVTRHSNEAVRFDSGSNWLIENVRTDSGTQVAQFSSGSVTNSVIADCKKNGDGPALFNDGDDNVVTGCTLIGSDEPNRAVNFDGNDCIFIANRIITDSTSGTDGILVGGTDTIVANNRITASGVAISGGGTGNILDSNLTR